MLPFWVGGDQPLPQRFRIGSKTRLIFDNEDGSSRVFYKQGQNPGLQFRLCDRFLDLLGNILDLAIAPHGHPN
jgi:hypothetical protein